jgi:hypothetical protein
VKRRIGKVTDWIAEAIGWLEEIWTLERWTTREKKRDPRNFPPPR